MTGKLEAPVPAAKRATQHVRLSYSNDAYEHSCILTLLSSLAPLHLMLADAPSPHGPGANLSVVGYIVRGLQTDCCLPALPRRLHAMRRTV
jgi:hypothetical protein